MTLFKYTKPVFLISTVLCLIAVIARATQKELIYSFNFNDETGWDSGWIKDMGTIDDQRTDNIDVVWNNDTNCPGHNTGVLEPEKPCARFIFDGSMARLMPTVGYHTIHLQLDCHAQDVEVYEAEWCYIEYKTATAQWNRVNITRGTQTVYNYTVQISDLYNNESSFEVSIGIKGDKHLDNCYFDNLRLFGIRYTANPTKKPTHGPTMMTGVSTAAMQSTIAYGSAERIIRTTIVVTDDLSDGQTQQTIVDLPFAISVSIASVLLITLCVCCLVIHQRKATQQQNPNSMIHQMETNVKIQKVPSNTNENARVERTCTGTPIGPQIVDNTIGSDRERHKDLEKHVLDVQYWLQNVLHLPQYFNTLIDNGYESLLIIKEISSAEELSQIGIKNRDHQNKIVHEIVELKRVHAHDPQYLNRVASLEGQDRDMMTYTQEGDNDELAGEQRVQYNMDAMNDEVVVEDDTKTTDGGL